MPGPDSFEAYGADGLGPTSPRLISSCAGAIQRVLFTLPRYVFQCAAYLGIYEDLLGKLPRRTQLVFVVHASVRALLDDVLRRLAVADRSTVIEAPDRVHFSVWVEDTCVVTQDAETGVVFLTAPVSLVRIEDARIAEIFVSQTDLRRHRTELYFEGGNVLIGDDFWLLGADHAQHSLHLGLVQPADGEPPLDAVRRSFGAHLDPTRKLHLVASTLPVPPQLERPLRLGGEDWTEVLYAGNLPDTVQPIFHIDMFVSLAGRDPEGRPIVLVGDPRTASEILGEPSLPQTMVPIYDDIARSLAHDGFQVIRNPLPLVHQDDPAERRRKWYFASSNNALVQISGTDKAVWLPSYGYGSWAHLAATDEANRQIWEALGFQVTMLTDCHALAYNLGGVHCIKKYVARGGAA